MLFEPAPAADAPPPIAGAVGFLEGAPALAACSSSSPTRCSTSYRAGIPADRIALVVHHGRPLARPCSRPSSRARGDPVCGRRARPPARDAARPRAASRSAALRLGRRRPRRALRVPALAVLGHRAVERRLRRGAAAWARDPGARATVETETERFREGASSMPLRNLREAEAPLDGVRARCSQT